MDSEPELPEWVQKVAPTLDSLAIQYQGLSQEEQIWFWIGSTAGFLLLIGGVGYLIYRTFSGLNTLLQSADGWRPINTRNWMWIGSGIWLLHVAHEMRQDANPGWSVAAVCGVAATAAFLWFMVHKLKLLRAIGASIANSCVGIILAPIVIQSVLLVMLLIVACIALWIAALFETRRVVYVSYR